MTRGKIKERLGGYWKLEAANAVIIPGCTVYIAVLLDWPLGMATAIALVAVTTLLIIGAQYWRAKLIQLESGDRLPPTIGLLARLQIPSLILCVGAAGAAIAAWIVPGFARSTADQWIASISALLAVLEYVNYYHRQLQHFDHIPDLKRLLSGRGFRESQMAADIARWRALN